MTAPLLYLLLLLSASHCYGALAGAHHPRIVNGTVAADGEFPFMVGFFYYSDLPDCGATILNENWVLTAAHCVLEYNVSRMSIVADTNKLNSDDESFIQVTECIIHEGFSMVTSNNDIALLKLAEPLTFGPKIQPVPLPEPFQQTAGGSPATVIGWGVTESTDYPLDLMKADVFVWSDEDCQEAYTDFFYPIYPSNICAGLPDGGRGQCNGDSGGPLIADGYQAGIVSWSRKPCANKGSPGVFTEVSFFIDWINEKTANTSSTSNRQSRPTSVCVPDRG